MEMNELKAALAERDNAIAGRLTDIEKTIGEHSEKWDARENQESRERNRKTGAKPVEHKVFETAAGPIFELPSHVKVADVLSPQQQPEISLARWFGAIVAGEKCGDRKAVEYVRERKDLLTTTSGILIPTEYQSQWIDLIRAQSVLNAAGMSTVVMNAKVQTSSAVTADPTAAWHTESASVNATTPTFAARSLTAQTLAVRVQASVELAQDSPDFGAQLAAVITGAMAAEVDRVGLVGSGTPPEPRGIVNTSGRGQVTGVGSVTNYQPLLRGVRTLLEANQPIEIATANAIMSPQAWYTFENLATGISSDKTQLPRPRALENTAFRITQGLDSDASPQTSTIVMGDFRDLVLGTRREASVEILKLGTYATNLQLEIIGYLRCDYLVRRPASFVTIEGVTVS